MTNEITNALAGLTVGAPAHAAGLLMFPLFPAGAARPAGAHYTVLREAIAAGTGHVTEVSAQGVVPLLRFRNDADRPVLLLDGEELVGCKQNRILNLSILAPARGDIEIPVSCVEMGRWRAESTRFHSEGRTMYAGLRAAKMARVSASLAQAGEARADQGEIWDSISEKSRRMGSSSSTQAMRGVFEQRERDIARITAALAPQPGQLGAVFAVRGRLAGVELFDNTDTLRLYLPGVVAGYALDALDTDRPDEEWHGDETAISTPPAPAGEVTLQAVREMLARIADTPPARRPGVGQGEDLRLSAQGLLGAALVDEGRVVHLCAFSQEGHGEPEQLSARRRRVSRPDWL